MSETNFFRLWCHSILTYILATFLKPTKRQGKCFAAYLVKLISSFSYCISILNNYQKEIYHIALFKCLLIIIAVWKPSGNVDSYQWLHKVRLKCFCGDKYSCSAGKNCLPIKYYGNYLKADSFSKSYTSKK